jgi:hypothetical protein
VFQLTFCIAALQHRKRLEQLKEGSKRSNCGGPVAETRHGRTRQRQRPRESTLPDTSPTLSTSRRPLIFLPKQSTHPSPPRTSGLLVHLCSFYTLGPAAATTLPPLFCLPSLGRFRNPATNRPYKALSTHPATLVHPPRHCSALLFATKHAPINPTPSCISTCEPRLDILIELATSGRGRSKHSELSPWVTA